MFKIHSFLLFTLIFLTSFASSSEFEDSSNSQDFEEYPTEKENWPDQDSKSLWERIAKSVHRSPFQSIPTNSTPPPHLHPVRTMILNLTWKSDSECQEQLDKLSMALCWEKCAQSTELHQKICRPLRSSTTVTEEYIMSACCPYG